MKDKPETVRFYRKRLPHWEVVDGRYFVTIRLQGAIPQAGRERIKTLREKYDEAVANGQDGLREQRAVFIEMERWLDRADTVDYLTRPAVAQMIKEAIEYRDSQGIWTMYAYTIMPNHVHLFFSVGRSSRERPVGTASRAVPGAVQDAVAERNTSASRLEAPTGLSWNQCFLSLSDGRDTVRHRFWDWK